MLTIYKRFWQVNWAEQWQYRANLFMYLAYWLVAPIVYLSVWTAVARAQGSVNGMTANDFAAYYLTLLPIDILTSSITYHIFGYKIQDGTLSNELIRPTHPILTNTLVSNISFKALIMLVLIPIWLVLYALFQPTLTITLGSFLLAVPALIMGFLISFLMESTITLIAFWTTRAYGPMELFWAAAQMLSGQFVPLTLLPGVAQTIAKVLPFQLWMYFPVQLMSNKLTPGEIGLNYGLQVVWLIALFVLFRIVWRAGIRKFSAVGG